MEPESAERTGPIDAVLAQSVHDMQGYNVAWSDADISMVSNIFTIMSRWWDFAGMWANGTSDPTNWVEKTAGYKLKVSPPFAQECAEICGGKGQVSRKECVIPCVPNSCDKGASPVLNPCKSVKKEIKYVAMTGPRS